MRNDTIIEAGPGVASSSIPRSAREAFPFLSPASRRDRAVVESQLGRPPRGEILVSRRCPHGRPAVVMTLPMEASGGPVPPLLWLTCPHASSLVGTLESSGAQKTVARRLEEDPEAAEDFAEDERGFAALQEELARSIDGDALAGRLGARGVAGGRMGAIKCLHAHLAYRLSIGPEEGEEEHGAGRRALPGRWCEEMLKEEGGAWCDEPPAACIA